MTRYAFLLATITLATLASAGEPLRVRGNTHALEMAPVWLAARDLGQEAVSISDGGIDSLASPEEADVAADSEIATVSYSTKNSGVRVVFTIAESYTRILARRSAGIGRIADLQGKRVGVVGASCEYSLYRLLASAGLADKVTVAPASTDQAIASFHDGTYAALMLPEPEMQGQADLLGADGIEFQNRAVYRETFNLNTTAEKLADPLKRRQIVAFVAALVRASERLRAAGQQASGAARQEAYYGGLAHDLPDLMADEDTWLATRAGRAPRSRAMLVSFVDPTVRLDAGAAAGHANAGTLAEARRRVERLSTGVDNVEAIRAVKALQYSYAQYVEQGRWTEASALFADDATAQIGDETLQGRRGVRDWLVRGAGEGKEGLPPEKLNLRMVLSPVVNLSADGMHAKGRWHEVAMLGQFGKYATWEGGIYENEYVLAQGVWKISRLHYYPQYAGPYETGWRSLPRAADLVPYHYDARSAGVPIPDAARERTREKLPETLRALADRVRQLEQRLERMNDASAVQNLQHALGFYVDRKLWDDVVDLFSVDGSLVLDALGTYTGHSAIRGVLDPSGKGGLQRGELNDHLQLETLVDVSPDGRTAHARGVQLGLTSAAGAGQWSESLYDGEYVKGNGVWMIRKLRIHPRMAADYVAGWAKSALPDPGLGNDFRGARSPVQRSAMDSPHPSARASTVTATPPIRTLPELVERIGDLERELMRAEAYDGAENISNAYGYYIDEFRWDDTAELFAREGWKELSYIGTYVGREHVRQSMVLRYGSNGRTGRMMTLHQKTQPVVDVAPDGLSARIRERLFQINSATDAPGSYIGGIYENEVVNEDGVWKIAGMDLDYVWTVSYSRGWARETPEDGLRFAPPAGAPPPPLAPDRPLRGVVTAPFPEIVDVPFHYRNPVSGRAPAVLLLP